ncbi:MAG: hypothetical protein ABF276_00425, partial [Sulfurovum sp.]
MTDLKKIALSAVAIAMINGCGDTTVNQTPSNVTIIGDTTTTTGTIASSDISTSDTTLSDAAILPKQTLSGDIDTDMTLNKETLWTLDGLVVVKPGVTLTIEPGTVIAGLDGTGDATSY